MKEKRESFVDKLWNAFSSMKLGLVLLGIVALSSAIGTLIPQATIDPEGAEAVNKIWKTLGFTNLYSSVWFQLLLGLLCINLIVCSVQRFSGIYNQTFKPKAPQNLNSIPQKVQARISGQEITPQRVEEVLKGKGFLLTTAEKNGQWSFVAQKRRWGNWGSFITHIAFVVLVIGALIGSLSGFKGYLMASEGETVPLRSIHITKGEIRENFSVKINSAEDRILPNGERDNWYTDLSILENGQEVARQTLSVNHPFAYKGVTFYQSQFSYGAKFTADVKGEKIPVVLSNQGGDFYRAPGTDLYLVVAALKRDPKDPIVLYQVYQGQSVKPVKMGQLKAGQAENIEGKYTLTFDGLAAFTGLQVKRDPGVPVVWVGSALLMFGLLLSFYWRPVTILGVLQAQDENVLTAGAVTGKLTVKVKEEFEALLDEIEGKNPS